MLDRFVEVGLNQVEAEVVEAVLSFVACQCKTVLQLPGHLSDCALVKTVEIVEAANGSLSSCRRLPLLLLLSGGPSRQHRRVYVVHLKLPLWLEEPRGDQEEGFSFIGFLGRLNDLSWANGGMRRKGSGKVGRLKC